MPSHREKIKRVSPLAGQAPTIRFLKDHLPLSEIMSATRERFSAINRLLLTEQINRHDQGHQFRTTVNAVSAMRQLGFEHREIMQAAAGALIHDIGYIRPDEPDFSEKPDDYHGGNRAKFKKHALYGGQEAEEKLQRLLKLVETNERAAEKWGNMVSYHDENGEKQRMDETDIQAITEAILNHNDYGKDQENYDPRQIGRGALMVQLFDKLDICRQRVYNQHLNPSAFAPESPDFDPKYFHRTVPFCIRNYTFSIDREDGTLNMTYHVDLSEFQAMIREAYPNFKYEEVDFLRDFQKAYTHNCRIAAEALGVIFDRPTSQRALQIKLKFTASGAEEMAFSRPDRSIYDKMTEPLRVRLSDLLQIKKAEVANNPA